METPEKKGSWLDEKSIFDALFHIIETIDALKGSVQKTQEDIILSEKLQSTLRDYLLSVVDNYQKIEKRVEKEKLLKERWRTAAVTLLTGYVIFLALIVAALYAR